MLTNVVWTASSAMELCEKILVVFDGIKFQRNSNSDPFDFFIFNAEKNRVPKISSFKVRSLISYRNSVCELTFASLGS